MSGSDPNDPPSTGEESRPVSVGLLKMRRSLRWVVAALLLLPTAYFVLHLCSKFALSRAIKASQAAGQAWRAPSLEDEGGRGGAQGQAGRTMRRDPMEFFQSQLWPQLEPLLEWSEFSLASYDVRSFRSFARGIPGLILTNETDVSHVVSRFWGGLGRRGDRDRRETEAASPRVDVDKLNNDIAHWMAMISRPEAGTSQSLTSHAEGNARLEGVSRHQIHALTSAARFATDNPNPALCLTSLKAIVTACDFSLRTPRASQFIELMLDNSHVSGCILWYALDSRALVGPQLAELQKSIESYDPMGASQPWLACLRADTIAEFDRFRSTPQEAMSHLLYVRPHAAALPVIPASWRQLLNPTVFLNWLGNLSRAPLKALNLDYFAALHWIYVDSYWEEREWIQLLDDCGRLISSGQSKTPCFNFLEALWRREAVWLRRMGKGTCLTLPSGIAFSVLNSEVTRLLALHAVALHRYREKYGEFPESMGMLVPEFLPKLPHDPLTGEPLFYRKGPDPDFTLYSVGFNGRDDGGDGSAPDWPGSYILQWIAAPGCFFPCGRDQVWPLRADSRKVYAAQEAWFKAVESGVAFR